MKNVIDVKNVTIKAGILAACSFIALSLSAQASGDHHGGPKSGLPHQKHSHGKVTLSAADAPQAGGSHNHAAETGHNHADGHAHAKKSAGPNGGRLITSVEPHAEFFVTPERTVQITFIDEQGKAVAPAAQSVTLTTGTRAAPQRIGFSVQEGVLVSGSALPAGDNLSGVLQIRPAAGEKVVTERFQINLAQCPTCNYAEYACICEGH